MPVTAFHRSCPYSRKDQCTSASRLIATVSDSSPCCDVPCFPCSLSSSYLCNTLGAAYEPVDWMPPLFGIAYFLHTIRTLRHPPQRELVHMFPYVGHVDPYIRQFVRRSRHSRHSLLFSRPAYRLAYLLLRAAPAFLQPSSPGFIHLMLLMRCMQES
ncbi:hypothetical protein D3C84_594910 [compost metagenome]